MAKLVVWPHQHNHRVQQLPTLLCTQLTVGLRSIHLTGCKLLPNSIELLRRFVSSMVSLLGCFKLVPVHHCVRFVSVFSPVQQFLPNPDCFNPHLWSLQASTLAVCNPAPWPFQRLYLPASTLLQPCSLQPLMLTSHWLDQA